MTWSFWAPIAYGIVVALVAAMAGIRYGRRADARARALLPVVVDEGEPMDHRTGRRPWRKKAHRALGAALRKVHVYRTSLAVLVLAAAAAPADASTPVVGQSVIYRADSTHSYRCKLTSTNDTGTPSYSIVRQTLQTLGN